MERACGRASSGVVQTCFLGSPKAGILGPKGRNIPAQGNALGTKSPNDPTPCKGITSCCGDGDCVALSGLELVWAFGSQGVAPGWYVRAFQALNTSIWPAKALTSCLTPGAQLGRATQQSPRHVGPFDPHDRVQLLPINSQILHKWFCLLDNPPFPNFAVNLCLPNVSIS